MVRNPFFKGDEYHPLTVRRDVWEPVFPFVAGDPLGLGVIGACAVGGHAPDVPASGTIRVEVDPLAVGRVLGSVVISGVGGQALLGAAVDRDAIDVEIVAALGAHGQPLSVRRPSVKIAGRLVS